MDETEAPTEAAPAPETAPTTEAPETRAPNRGDHGVDPDAAGRDDEPAEDTGDDKPKAKPADKPAKLKFKRGGADHEVDPSDHEALIKLLSDQPSYKVTIDKQERDAKLEDLIKDYELRQTSYGRMEQAAAMRKEAEQWKQKLRDDHGALREFLLDLGFDNPFASVEAEYLQMIETEALNDPKNPAYNPAAYRQAIEERTMRDAERKQARLAKAEQEKREAQARAEAEKRYVAAFPEALKAHGLELSPVVAGVLRQINTLTNNQLDPAQLAYEAKRALDGHYANTLPSDVEVLAELLGEERLKALRARDVKAAKAEAKRKASGEQNGKAKTPTPATGKPGNISDLLRAIRS